MIIVTGDKHGGADGGDLSLKNTLGKKEKYMTKNDFLIIAGDFGYIWRGEVFDDEREKLDWLNARAYTVLFVDGNHENFPILNTYPVIDFHGGKAHKIREHVYHLMRGEVFELGGLKVLAMGGAKSIDRQWRIKDVSWWEDEVITEDDYQNALKNLAKHDFKADAIVSHTCPSEILPMVLTDEEKIIDDDPSCVWLQKIMEKIKFEKWYFGHFHKNKILTRGFRALYHDFAELKL